ncbi:MAG: lytic transglycosylase domain-containing protein [Acidimicrobiales bacterium]
MNRTAIVVLAALAVAGCNASQDPTLDRVADRPTTTTAAPTTTEVPSTTSSTDEPAPAPDVRPVAASDPARLAQQIAEVEAVIHDPSTSPEALAAAAHLQQVAFRKLADNPSWDAEVTERVGPELSAAVAANVAAGRELRALVRNPKPNLPAWRIVEPAPASELRTYYEAGEAEFGVPWQYLAAVHLTETRMGRIRGVSTAGAQGPMQFIPSTWDAYGEGDIESNRDAIRAAARYLAANGGDCRPGAPCDLGNALHRYNPTPKYVKAVTAYAERMRADEASYAAYHGWQVYYLSTLGDVWLRVGYEATEERPVTEADLR